MSLIDEMRNLREDIESGKKIRSQFIAGLEKDVEVTRKENRAKQQELKNELSAALAAFWGKKRRSNL